MKPVKRVHAADQIRGFLTPDEGEAAEGSTSEPLHTSDLTALTDLLPQRILERPPLPSVITAARHRPGH